MFFRFFLCVVVLAITATAQARNSTPVDEHPFTVVVAVSPNGQTLAVARGNSGANRYGRVELWDTQTGELQRTITGFDGPVWSLTFSRDGRALITASTEYHESKIQTSVKDRNDASVGAELKWWNAETGEFIKKVSLASEGVASLEAAWSPSGDLIAIAERHTERQMTQVSVPGPFGPRIMMPGYVNFEENELRLLDAETGQRRLKLEDAFRRSRGAFGSLYARLERPVFSSDGTKVAALTAEEVSVWAAASGR